MLKKLIENWWINANERTFQFPFAFHLVHDGHAVLHVSRHCGMELGKDILSVDGNGLVHSFQLKGCNGGKLSLSYWRQELSAQIDDLVLSPVVHSSLPGGKAINHQAWLVCNGGLEEELTRAINDRNETYESLHGRRLNVLTIGPLIAKSIEIEAEFWPPNPEHSRDIFEAYLDDGRRVLNKERLSRVLKGMVTASRDVASKAEITRISHSMMLLTSLLVRQHAAESNWVAQIEAWVMCWSHCQASWVRLGKKKTIAAVRADKFAIALIEVYLTALRDECIDNPELHSAKGHFDIAYDIMPVKSAWIIGLLSVCALRQREANLIDHEAEALLETIAQTEHTRPRIWGEASIPQFLAWHFVERCRSATQSSERLLADLLNGILLANSPKCNGPFPTPYIEADAYLTAIHADDQDKISDMVSDQCSYWLEPVVDLLASQLYRQAISRNWDAISRITNEEFVPNAAADFFLWRCDDGVNRSRSWQMTQSWEDLKAQAAKVDVSQLPAALSAHVWLTCLFFIVFPHRKDRNLFHWLDEEVWKLAERTYDTVNT